MKKQRPIAIRYRSSSRVEIGDGVTWRDVGGDVVILNVETGAYFGLDGAGASIWRELVEHGSLEKAFAALKNQFDVDPAELRNDLDTLVAQLVKKELVLLIDAKPKARSR